MVTEDPAQKVNRPYLRTPPPQDHQGGMPCTAEKARVPGVCGRESLLQTRRKLHDAGKKDTHSEPHPSTSHRGSKCIFVQLGLIFLKVTYT